MQYSWRASIDEISVHHAGLPSLTPATVASKQGAASNSALQLVPIPCPALPSPKIPARDSTEFAEDLKNPLSEFLRDQTQLEAEGLDGRLFSFIPDGHGHYLPWKQFLRAKPKVCSLCSAAMQSLKDAYS